MRLPLLFLALLGLATAPIALRAQVLDPTFASPASLYAPATVYTLGPQQADGKRLVGGTFTRVNGTPVSSALLRLDATGALDAAFMQNVGAAGNINHIRGTGTGQYLLGAKGGDVTAGGLVRSEVLRLNADGTADATFNPGTGPGMASRSDAPYSLDFVAQPDGKVLVTGYFDSFNSVAANGVVRLNANGSVDTGFSTGAGIGIAAGISATADAVAVQADGKVLVAGTFTSFNGVAAPGVVRLTATGSLDPTFAPALQANSQINSIVVQPDGNILLSGYLYTSAGAAGLVRLTPSGSLDPGFSLFFANTALTANFDKPVVLQADGKLVVTGDFALTGANKVARLNANGTLDTSFYIGAGLLNVPQAIGVQADGTVLVGGYFNNFAGGSEQPLVRLTTAGSLDAGFAPKLLVPGLVSDVVRQPDGQLLVGGNFVEYNGVPAHRLVRVSAGGVPDASFAAAGSLLPGPVLRLALQADGKVLAGTTNGLVRVAGTGALDASFTPFPLFAATAVAVQADGKVLLGGMGIGGGAYTSLVRLTSTGALDPTFTQAIAAGVGTFSTTDALLVQPDGRIVAAGLARPALGASSTTRLVRYESTGAIDATFNTATTFVPTAASGNAGRLYALALQPDGKLLAGGLFGAINSTSNPQYGVARFLSTGAVDPSFSSTSPLRGTVYSLAVQPNGRVLLGGIFTTQWPASSPTNLARLLADGTPDSSFSPSGSTNTTSIVRSVLVQPDGGIVLGGNFSAVGGQARLVVARLNAPNVLAVAAPATVAARTQAWPVPAHGVLHVAPDASAQPLLAELLDALGRPVRQQTVSGASGEFTLPVEGLPVGMYVLRVTYAAGVVTRRLAVE